MSIMTLIPALLDDYFIKVIFLVNILFQSLVSISNGPSSYTTYNSILLICLILSITVDKNANILLLATTLNVLCIALDVIVLIGSYIFVFPTIIIVLNLLLRPLTTILLLKNYSARAGVADPTSGLLEVAVHPQAAGRSTYQNIDEPNQTLP